MRKLIIQNLTVVFLFFYFTSVVFPATITSTAEGGPWPESSTWIGGYVPGPYDDVVINGPVKASQSSCNNITVNPSGSLTNWGDYDTLYVLGNMINYGTVTYYYHFILNVEGDVTNDGTWQSGVYTYLTGASDHHIATLNGNSFNMSLLENTGTGNVYIDTFASFDNVIIKMNNVTLFIADNATLEIKQQHLDNCFVSGAGNASVIYGVKVNNSGPAFNSVSFSNVTLEGVINVGTDCFTHGTVINNGILQNNWVTRTLTVADGVFFNQDTIRNYNQWLNIDIYSNFINYGYVANYNFTLKGSQDQFLSQGTSNVFACTNFNSDKAAGKIHFLSNIIFDNCHIETQNDTLLVANGMQIELLSSEIINSILDCETPDGMLKINMKGNSQISNAHISNTEFLGKCRLGDNNLYGEILVTDTIQNPYSSSTLTIHGSITNDGLVTNDFSYFILNIEGDLSNNGIWQCTNTGITGSGNQHIDLADGSTFNSDLTFTSELTGGSYQWDLNDTVIPASSPCFYGETSVTLHLGSNITSCYDGRYYCMIDGAESRKIFVNRKELRIKMFVLLEGAYEDYSMNTYLSNMDVLPLAQPYNTSPWNYGGTESVTEMPENAVDWVLVDFYNTTEAALITPANKVASQAALLLSNGIVSSTDGAQYLTIAANITDSLFVVIRHRNHLPVLSAVALQNYSGLYFYDFSIDVSQAYQSGQKSVDGVGVMYGGDANADGTVDINDTPVWFSEVGKSGYLPSDANLDGQSDNKDKNDIWVVNFGTSSTVPN